MTVTGERVSTPEGGFNPTWQRHVAAYAMAAEVLGPGRVLDLGCGVGHSFHRLAPRETVGVDVDSGALAGQARPTVVADMRDLPFADADFASVLSVHSLEHVPDPLRAVTEAARVLQDDGVAVFVTPNRLTFGRPDELIDPFHHVELDARQLHDLCRHAFDDVQVAGIAGSARYLALHDDERATLDRLLARDPLRARRFVPLAVKRRLYDTLLRRNRRVADPRAAAIEPEDFRLVHEDLDAVLDVVAICRGPRRRAVRRCAWCGADVPPRARRLPGRVVCPACGAQTTEPFPDAVEFDAAYAGWYRPAGAARFGHLGDALLARTRGALARRVDAVAPSGPVLDVGAGDGTLVRALEARGRAATGLERADRGLAAIEPGWAAVTMWHALEHLPDPHGAVREAARLLQPGGLLVVAVPNAASLQARVFGGRWLALDLPRHVVHLTPDALASGLRDAGFTVTRTSRTRGGQSAFGWLHGFVGAAGEGLDLYAAIRSPAAREVPMDALTRATTLATALLLSPAALACAAAEALLGRQGTLYVEAGR